MLCTSLLLSSCGLASGRGGLDAGLKYQASGQYRAAYIEAKKVLQRDDKNGTAWLLLGQASLKLGDPKEALNDLQKAKANGVPQARWAVPMARALLVTQQYDKALATLSDENTSNPRTRCRSMSLRGDAYMGLKELDQAKQSFQAAVTLDPKDPDALIGLAKLANAAHDAGAAAKLCATGIGRRAGKSASLDRQGRPGVREARILPAPKRPTRKCWTSRIPTGCRRSTSTRCPGWPMCRRRRTIWTRP